MSTPRELGAQLRAARLRLGESQQEAAAALGVTRQWLTRVEAGTGNPDVRQLFALCDHLGVRLAVLPAAELPSASAGAVRMRVRRGAPVAAALKAGRSGSAGSASVGSRSAGAVRHAAPAGPASTVDPASVDLDALLAGYTSWPSTMDPVSTDPTNGDR